jgi:hypothetical protein
MRSDTITADDPGASEPAPATRQRPVAADEAVASEPSVGAGAGRSAPAGPKALFLSV